jgi:hypothetical protein
MTLTRESASTTRAGWVRRHRAALLVGTAFLLAVGVSVLTGRQPPYSERLDPGNAGPDGARAVARVLSDQGIEVTVVRDADAFDGTRITGSTTVLVTSVGNLGPSTADRLLAHARGTRLVVVDPPVGSLGLFHLPEGVRVRDPGTVRAACDDPVLNGLAIEVDRATAFPVDGEGCFGAGKRAHHALLVTDPVHSISVLGAGGLLTNDQVVRADNAAVALRLLGQRDRLVWYVADDADLLGSDAVGLGSLLPDWLGPALWLVALAIIALALWRGRRLGALAVEPLPVAVTAIESTESRGRLYRKVNDRAHAAQTLRGAARTRIAKALRLPRSSSEDPETLVRDVAGAGGLDPARVRDLLSPDAAVPRTDKDLTQLANDLAELDREVRRS